MVSKMKTISKLALATLGALAIAGSAMAEERSMTLSGSGGVVAKISQEVYLAPFAKETGITVKRVGTEAKRMAQLEAMVRSGKILWDAMEVSASDYPIGVKKNLLEPIDYSLIDPDNKLPAAARKKFAVGAAAYSQILAVRNDKLPAGKKMTSWADFWDVKNFPGPRALRGRPADNLEFALLADGVTSADLYKVLSTKEGVDRAFAKLDEIKPHITVWWKSGAQSVQLLSDGEVFYSTSYNGRITKLASSGIDTAIVWNGGALHMSFVGIPKGAKKNKEAHEYARYRTMNADRMRAYITNLPYPGFAPGLYDGLDAKIAGALPTHPDNLAAQFAADEEFWAANIEEIQERWSEWLLQ